MRLYPPVSEDEAYSWLRSQALQRWPELTPTVDEDLKALAKAMAVVGSLEVPETVEPG